MPTATIALAVVSAVAGVATFVSARSEAKKQKSAVARQEVIQKQAVKVEEKRSKRTALREQRLRRSAVLASAATRGALRSSAQVQTQVAIGSTFQRTLQDIEEGAVITQQQISTEAGLARADISRRRTAGIIGGATTFAGSVSGFFD